MVQLHDYTRALLRLLRQHDAKGGYVPLFGNQGQSQIGGGLGWVLFQRQTMKQTKIERNILTCTNLCYGRTAVSSHSLDPFSIKYGLLLIQSLVHVTNITLLRLQHTWQIYLKYKVNSMITL